MKINTRILYLQNFKDYLRSRTALNWLVDIFAAFTLFGNLFHAMLHCK